MSKIGTAMRMRATTREVCSVEMASLAACRRTFRSCGATTLKSRIVQKLRSDRLKLTASVILSI